MLIVKNWFRLSLYCQILLALILGVITGLIFGPPAAALSLPGKVIGVIFIGVPFGIALRNYRKLKVTTVEDLTGLLLNTLIHILHWIISMVPLAVFGIIASIVGVHGLAVFKALVFFVTSVLAALSLQTLYYMVRIRFGSSVRPLKVLNGNRAA
jgi:Na+/H+-dicarboxylate symporter